MKLRVTLCFILSLFFSIQAYAASIDKIIVFGDSLSDNGNIYNFTSTAHKIIPSVPVMPKSPPYYAGRFSNGPVWDEALAANLHLTGKDQLVNYALGGAWAETIFDSKQIYPSDVETQVSNYISASLFDFHKSQHLYVIWIGANDYLGARDDMEHATSTTVNIIKSQIDRLVFFGAKNILLLNIPDLGLTPRAIAAGPNVAAALTKISELHNAKLSAMVNEEQHAHSNAKIILFDTASQIRDVTTHPEKYHLKNVTKACFEGSYSLRANINAQEIQAAKEVNLDIVNNPSLNEAYTTSMLTKLGVEPCTNPDEYLFWDGVHPSRVMHKMLANLVQETLKNNNIQGPV
jgi:phospholipase/lecithinase/hemolysin